MASVSSMASSVIFLQVIKTLSSPLSVMLPRGVDNKKSQSLSPQAATACPALDSKDGRSLEIREAEL